MVRGMPGSMPRYLILFSTRSPLTNDHWTVSPLRMPMASARALGMVTMNWSFGSCCTLTRRGIGHIEYDGGFNIYVSVQGVRMRRVGVGESPGRMWLLLESSIWGCED